jgi:hypothetical protein
MDEVKGAFDRQYYKISRAFVDGQPVGNLTGDHVLDNITLYWLTGTGASAARSYWESYGAAAVATLFRLGHSLRRLGCVGYVDSATG